MPSWSADDIRIVSDIIVGSILARGLQLVTVKAFLEPAAVFIGQAAYRRADAALGDRLPDWVPPVDSESVQPPPPPPSPFSES